jgi:hypothetical protein
MRDGIKAKTVAVLWENTISAGGRDKSKGNGRAT